VNTKQNLVLCVPGFAAMRQGDHRVAMGKQQDLVLPPLEKLPQARGACHPMLQSKAPNHSQIGMVELREKWGQEHTTLTSSPWRELQEPGLVHLIASPHLTGLHLQGLERMKPR